MGGSKRAISGGIMASPSQECSVTIMAIAVISIVMTVMPSVEGTHAHHHKEYRGNSGGKWEAGNWSPCILDKERFMDSEGLCRGYRLRFVICRVRGSISYTDSECSTPPPARAIHCKTTCPQNCIVGPWSRWSSCSCQDTASHRMRTVLVAPSQGSEPCPALIQSRPCIGDCLNISSSSLLREDPFLDSSSPNFKLRVGKWGPCQAVPRGEAMTTEKRQARRLEELREDGGPAEEGASKRTRMELPESWERDKDFDYPPKRGLLGLSLNKNWGRSYNSILDPRHKNSGETLDFHTHFGGDFIGDEEEPSSSREEILATDEEIVIPEEDNDHQEEEDEKDEEEEEEEEEEDSDNLPVIGRQERKMACIHSNGTRIPLRFCISALDFRSMRHRTCIVDRDCLVTQWSSWETIVPGCIAPNGLVVREVRERRRRGLALQQGNGVPCPHLLEKHTLPDPSLQPCDTKYQWVSSAWGPCMASAGTEETPIECGGGVQTRQLTCVRASDQIPVHDDLCIHVEPPPRVQRCEVGCERDCVVGPWSNWGMCTIEDCAKAVSPATPGMKRRHRDILISPSRGGRECPPLQEQSECPQSQCHTWIYGNWSRCQLENLDHTCGPGFQTRNYTCLDSFGRRASLDRCEQELGLAAIRQECHVPCAFDCVVGTWSLWSPCSRSCASQYQVGFTHRNTSVIAPPGPGGLSCPAPDELTQVETCREEPCGGASWSVGPWYSCILPAGSQCGPGRQKRQLFCRNQANETLDVNKCRGLKKPRQERECQISCGTDCTITSWSEWSPCLTPDPCPIHGVLISSVQRRWRRILVSPSEGGKPCPPLEEERECAHAPVTCTRHHWKTGKWSSCMLAMGSPCGTGYRVRSVECVDTMGRSVESSFCLMSDTLVPSSSEECEVWCQDDCVTSSWSAWVPCPAQCSHTAYRSRELLDGSNRTPACRNISQEENKPCPCHNYYTIPTGPWSSCLLDAIDQKGDGNVGTVVYNNNALSVTNEADICGVGKRYRALLCKRDDGVLAHSRSCGHTGVEMEPCMIECPLDCQVGPWGPWSACNTSCGSGLQNRTREIFAPSLWGGRPCPETVQHRACFGSCKASWIPGGWTQCQILPDMECGNGMQTRTVRCMREVEQRMQAEVPESQCDSTIRPVSEQPCVISCPGECVVTPWSTWSSCAQGCPREQYRFRTREVVRQPVNIESLCPLLREEEPCIAGMTCLLYTWQVGNWTSCVPLGHSSCGEGVRNRPVSCVDSNGISVADWYCPRELKPSPSETWCYVDCPIDCEVTAWTAWDDSKCSCAESPGEMIRRRFLAVNPSELGRPCPAELRQSKPCPAIPCYTWQRSRWSECQLEGGYCGHGYVERNVSCVGPGGQSVDPKHCLALVHVGGHTWPYLAKALDLNKRDGCYVPCKGDCELTEWAPWSHCHRECTKGHQGGIQTRSRAILKEGTRHERGELFTCPGQLWETRPCLAGPCLTYKWQVYNGSAECIRSDGTIVTGGCENEPKPCFPECMVGGSLCSSKGVCVCRAGLRARYAETPKYRLRACTPILNLTSLPQPLSEAKYLPDINFWMFAMIGVGSAFLVFVVMSMYLLCQSPREPEITPLTIRRQKTMRHRPV